MSLKIVTLPNIGDFKDTPIIEILVQVGDTIDLDDSIITLESDKSSMEVPSPNSGKVHKILVEIGDKINPNDPILELEVTNNQTDTSSNQDKQEPNTQQSSHNETKPDQISPEPQSPSPNQSLQAKLPNSSLVPTINKQSFGAKYHASPKVRQFANKLGADISRITGTAYRGRITQDDVTLWVKKQLTNLTGTSSSAIPQPPEIDFSTFGKVKTAPLSRIQKISGKHLSICWLNAPHVTQFDEVDIQDLEEFRQATNKKNRKKANAKISPLAFIVKAITNNLLEFPNFNASLSHDQQNLILKEYINIGIAMDTPNGLVVPVIKQANHKSIQQLANELIALNKKSQAGKLLPEEMSGGSFSISSLGNIGGTHFTPIINLPEVAILGVGRSSIKPQWDNGKFVPSLKLPLSLSYDHRVINGAEGARFMVSLGKKLADIRNLVL